jgi:serine/threonine protein phosphatase PrpC
MTFSLLTGTDGKPAPTLEQVMEFDWQQQHRQQRRQEQGHAEQEHDHYTPLHRLQEALGLGTTDATVVDTLDVVLISLLEAISFIHSQGIVHRDLKPANLLVSATHRSLVLIDFGSAADMDPVSSSLSSSPKMNMNPFSFGKRRIGLEDDSVAISPIYAAPELFVKPDRAPFAFDVFSAALIFCQVLFNYLDIRTDAAFHQQIQDANYDLDAWLSRELSSKVRPAGFEAALDYLEQRSGLWGLLRSMFRADPEQRISSVDALANANQILESTQIEGRTHDDGLFFESVLRALDQCPVEEPDMDFVAPRPLHFVASFRRGEPLGLVLSEAGDVELDGDKLTKWNEATKEANLGDVFVMDIVPGSQADSIGIFEIGDQLQAVGDVPVGDGGFEKVVGMIQGAPKSINFIKLQFDRQSVRRRPELPDDAISSPVRIADEGAWSSLGRRRANEDFFVLHDIHLDRDMLIAGVFDGHGGKAAAQSASQLMPSLFTEHMTKGAITSRQALDLAWQNTCDSYRNACDEMGECVAEYDAQDGVLLASTGSEDLIAGTTASVVALNENELTVLNCGDSRTLLIDTDGEVVFETIDHSPETEAGRLKRGKEHGLDYSLPECSLSKWWLQCGDMQYAVARSLEGPFATSKGIVSTPDVTSLRPIPGVVLIASDGLWEVSGNEEVAKEVTRLRRQGMDAGDAAKQLCSKAVQSGSTDNVSVVLIYLE